MAEDTVGQAGYAARRPAPSGGEYDDQSDTLTCAEECLAGATCLSMTGELDLATLSLFRARLRSVSERTDDLVLDLGALRSIDSTGVHALLDAYQTITLAGRRMAIVAVPSRVQKVLAAFDVDEIIPVFSCVDAVLANFYPDKAEAIRVARLRKHPVHGPFRFRFGDRVAWKRYNDTADEEVRGTIIEGTCVYALDGGARQQPIYVVACDNGRKVTAAEMTLMLVRPPASDMR